MPGTCCSPTPRVPPEGVVIVGQSQDKVSAMSPAGMELLSRPESARPDSIGPMRNVFIAELAESRKELLKEVASMIRGVTKHVSDTANRQEEALQILSSKLDQLTTAPLSNGVNNGNTYPDDSLRCAADNPIEYAADPTVKDRLTQSAEPMVRQLSPTDSSRKREWHSITIAASTGASHGAKLFGNIQDGLAETTALDEEEYDVAIFYKDTGCAQAIARNTFFGNLTLGFIVANAIYLGVDADLNEASNPNKADWYFIVSENIFCTFFSFEWLMRFLAFKNKRNCLKDMWFKFDSVLVVIMVLETWVVPPLLAVFDINQGLPSGPIRLLRLLRLARMVRIMRALPELITLVNGMYVATRAVSSSMLMLFIIVYVFGIAMRSFMDGEDEVHIYWGSLGRCMMTLIANGMFGDSIGTVMRGIDSRSPPALFAFAVFVILSAVTVTNMLIGVLCEVVTEVKNAEENHAAITQLKATVLAMLKALDEDNSGLISKDELLQVCHNKDALAVMQDMGISVAYFTELLDMYYETGGERTMPFIMQLLLDLQGNNPATLKDVVSVLTHTRWWIRQELNRLPQTLRITSACPTPGLPQRWS